jgi:hypothetical protein
MNILYVLKRESNSTLKNMIEQHKKDAEVSIIDMYKNKNYDEIIAAVANSDKVITW